MRWLAMTLLGSTALLSACASSGTKVTAEQAAAFTPGVSRESDVVARLGEPDSEQFLPDGRKIDRYSYVAASANAVDFIPVVGLLAGGAHGTSSATTFVFDRQHVLVSVGGSRSQQDVRSGLLNQW